MRSGIAEFGYNLENIYNEKSAGITLKAKVKLTVELIKWADIIF
jgi:predicted protein tyrosine phosphatase